MIATAIGSQVARATAAFATVVRMIPRVENERRRQRFLELLSAFDNNKAELGRALGWTSGAYVRQLAAGERPISEGVIEKVHAMQGGKFRGWFALALHVAESLPAAYATAPWPLAPYFTPETWAELGPGLQHVGAHAAAKAIREARELVDASGKPLSTGT